VITIGRCSVDLYGQQIGSRLEDVASFAKSVGGAVPIIRSEQLVADSRSIDAALFRTLALEHAVPEQQDLRHRFSA